MNILFDFKLVAEAKEQLSALGLANAVVTLAISRVAERPAMNHLRRSVFGSLALLWLGILLVLVQSTLGDLPGSFTFRCGWQKLGLFSWILGLFWGLRVLYLAIGEQPRLRSLPWRWPLQRKLRPFTVTPRAYTQLGSEPLNLVAARLLATKPSVAIAPDGWYPIVLTAERGLPSLGLALRFLLSGLEDASNGAVHVTLTRPAEIIVKQLTRHCAQLGLDAASVSSRIIIVDGFSPIHLHGSRAAALEVPWKGQILSAMPTDPAKLLAVYKKALLELQRARCTSVRVIYDSFTDMLVLTDPERAGAFMRHVTVFDELWGVQSLYIAWHDVGKLPLDNAYLAYVSNTYLHIRSESGKSILSIGAANRTNEEYPICLDEVVAQPQLENISNLVQVLNGVGFAGVLGNAFPGRSERQALEFYFFVVTASEGALRTLPEKDRLWQTARKKFEADPSVFKADRIVPLARKDWRSIFGTQASEADLARLEYAAQILNLKYAGSVQALLDASKSRLFSRNDTGLLQRLSDCQRYGKTDDTRNQRLYWLLHRLGAFRAEDAENGLSKELVRLALRLGLVQLSSGMTSMLGTSDKLDRGRIQKLRAATLEAIDLTVALATPNRCYVQEWLARLANGADGSSQDLTTLLEAMGTLPSAQALQLSRCLDAASFEPIHHQ